MVIQKLSLQEAERILKQHKIAVPATRLAKNKEDAIKSARIIGFPVVMKVESSSIFHKSDVGGVKLGINNEYDAGRAYDEITRKIPKDKIDSIIIQKMHEGHYVIIGMKRDKQFGPVIAFGLGGIFVEVFKDISLRVAPLTKKECISMIKETKTYPILAGARGTKKANINKIADILMKISELALKNSEIKEIDLNPVVVNSKEAVAVDVRIIK